jgi:hypothetical protein
MTERTVNLTKYTYSRTASGKSWKSKPDTVEHLTVSWEQYLNMTSPDTCRFFRRLGGSEFIKRSYTAYGYLPIELISCSPLRDKKTVRVFDFN